MNIDAGRENIMKKRSTIKTRKSGFTLIELLVVVAVVAIMAVMVTPNIIKWVIHSRFRTAVTDLSINLKLAKSTAIKTNSNCEVTFNASGSDRYAISCLGRSVNFDQYNAGARYSSDPPSSLTFTSRGLPASNIGTAIYISNESNQSKYKVQVSPSGAIYTDKL